MASIKCDVEDTSKGRSIELKEGKREEMDHEMQMEEQSSKRASTRSDLTSGPVVSTLLWFTLPFLLANILQTLYGTVDTLTVGNFGSTAGVSAVATGAQLLSLATFLSIGLSNGGTVLVGQCIGAKDYKRAAKIVGNIIIDFAVISVVLMVFMLIMYPTLLEVLNIPDQARMEACQYMKICSLGIPLIVGYNIVCALLRAMGDSKTPLIFVFIACVVNILGDLLLTGYFHMGAAGVAIATVCAQGISFLFSLIYIMKKGMTFEFHKSDIRFEGHVTAEIFKVGIPLGVQSVLVNLSFLFITSIINSLGLTASAAMGIGDKIIGFAFMPQSALSAAVAAIVAQNVGANKPKRIIDTLKASMGLGFAIETCFFAICLIWPEFFPALFSGDAEVVQMAGEYMMAYGIDAMLTSLTFCLGGMLNGCGKTTFNMAQNLASTFLGRVPATYILSKIAGGSLFMIGLAAPASSVVSLVLLLIYLKMGKWKKGIFPEKA